MSKDREYPEHGSEKDQQRSWERGDQGAPSQSDRDPGPAGSDQAPAEFADDQGGEPEGSDVPTGRPQDREKQPPLIGSGKRPAAHGESDDATGGAKA